MAKEDTGTYVSSKIPDNLKDLLNQAIKNGNYLNVSDFVRDAVREKLQREGFLQLSQGA